MTLTEVRTAVLEIQKCANDPEVAHLHEDDLHVMVLKAIANGECVDCTPDQLAHAALATLGLGFPRWCA